MKAIQKQKSKSKRPYAKAGKRPKGKPTPRTWGKEAAVGRPRGRHRGSAEQLEAVFMGSARGYGFVPHPDGGDDIFIPAAATMGALDGDTVAVEFWRARGYLQGARTEGRVTAILKERSPFIIGTVEEIISPGNYRRPPSSRLILVPASPRLSIRPAVYAEGLDFKAGDKVKAALEKRPHGQTGGGLCRILEVFGDADSKDANYRAILAALDVPTAFSPEAAAEADALAARPLSDEGRVRRTETILTIDGADAKDLDDAVSVKRLKNGNYLLGVHIADVSAYVLPGSALDAAAMERGTSLYFTDKVVPMLPPALSNGACSLNAGEDKLVVSALLTVDGQGEPVEVRLEKGIMRSKVRGVYSEVNDLLEAGKASPYYEKYKEVEPTLRRLRALYGILHERRVRLGGLELDRPEAKILLNEAGHPVDIVRRERGLAERIIEECMLMANEGVARLLSAKGRPCVYRVHGAPSDEHVAEFAAFAACRGLRVPPLSPPYNGRQLACVLDEAKKKGIGEPVSYILLRTMEKAKYSAESQPHFGLGLSLYCHFTSPIRRLSDLATHRIVSELLEAPEGKSRLRGFARRAADAATDTELRALAAERQIEALYKALYMQDRRGEVFAATVSSVTSFGIFAELDNTCEGLIPMSELGFAPDFDEVAKTVTVGGHTYRIGDALSVRVEEVDIATARVRFSLEDIL